MLDQQVPVLGLHVTFSSLASSLEPLPEITWSGLEAETKAACDHSIMHAAYPAWRVPGQMTQRTMDTKSCVDGSLPWLRRMEPFDSDVLRSPMCSFHACPVLLGPNEKRRLPHKTGAPTSSFSCLAGFAAIATGRQELPQEYTCSMGCDPTVTSQPSLS